MEIHRFLESEPLTGKCLTIELFEGRTFTTPPVPPMQQIRGWDRAVHDQIWRPTVNPNMDTYAIDEKTGEAIFNDVQITFIEQELNIASLEQPEKGGFWFYNNGEPTYITGMHYLYMCYWPIKGRLPVYLEADRDFQYFKQLVWTNDNTLGYLQLSFRQKGKTEQMAADMYFHCSLLKFNNGGIQSKTERDAKAIFRRIVQAWRGMPQWLKPADSGNTNPLTKLSFNPPSKVSSKTKVKPTDSYRGGEISFGSSDVIAYDGQPLDWHIADEVGKDGPLDAADLLTVLAPLLKPGGISRGKTAFSSTIGVIEGKGLKNAYDLWINSAPNENDVYGKTTNGLWRYFVPREIGMFGHTDVYGKPILNDPPIVDGVQTKVEALRMDGADCPERKRRYVSTGVRTYFEEEEKGLTGQALLKHRRNYPRSIEDMFATSVGEIFEADINDTLTDLLEGVRNEEGQLIPRSDNEVLGRLVLRDGKMCFVPDTKGWLVEREPPQSGVRYGIGGDPTGTDMRSGALAGGNGVSDFAIVAFKGYHGEDKLNYADTHYWVGRPPTMQLAWQRMVDLAKYFRDCGALFQVNCERSNTFVNGLGLFRAEKMYGFLHGKPNTDANTKNKGADAIKWTPASPAIQERQKHLMTVMVRETGGIGLSLALVKDMITFGKGLNADRTDALKHALMCLPEISVAKQKETTKKEPVKVRTMQFRDGKMVWVDLWN
jgi:hypothetical protein